MELGRSVDQEGREALLRDLGQAGVMGQGNEVQHHQVPGPALGSQPHGSLQARGAVAGKVASGKGAVGAQDGPLLSLSCPSAAPEALPL